MSHTVLVADDSLTIRQIVGMALKASPYRLVEAASARQTLDAAQSRPDVILLDYYMPDGSGYDVCRALKNNASTRHIPVVMLGGSYKNFDENQARQAGADVVVMKPFKTDQLVSAIESALRRPAASAAAMASSGPQAQPMGTSGGFSQPAAPRPGAPTGLPLPMPGQGMGRQPAPAQSGSQPRIPAPIGRQPLPAPSRGFNTGTSSPKLDPAPVHAPTPMPSAHNVTAPAHGAPSQQSAAPVQQSAPGMDKGELEEFIREEVRKVVRDELPNLLRTIMGDLLQQKLLPKILQSAEARIETVIQEKMQRTVQDQVRAELEQLLND